MVDTVYCTIHVRSMQAKCIMILYVTLNQDYELGPTRILRIYTQLPMYCIHCVQFTVYSTGYTVQCTVQAGVHVEAPNIISKLKYKYKHGNLCIILNSTNVQSYVTHCTLYSKLRKFVQLPTFLLFPPQSTTVVTLSH